MSKLKTALYASILIAGSAAPSLAQVSGYVDSFEGDVVVERDGAIYSTQNMGAIENGDVVMNFEGSSSRIVLENNCAIDLGAEQSVRINADAENCENSFVTVDQAYAANFESQNLQLGVLPLYLGALAVGAVIIAVNEDDKNDQPTSP